MKKVLSIHRQGEGHWVGDGFPVHTVFHYEERPELTPFILLDHAGPAEFAPAGKPRGVGWHPHRGFETVTVVFDGEVDHEDTAGNGGRGPAAQGDAQREFLAQGRALRGAAVVGEPPGEVDGQPLEEPVVGHGPFVMNTSQEIRQAFVDFHYGKMGKVLA